MTSRGPDTVSTIASGRAPMAARSLTLASTADTPRHTDPADTKLGSIASPPTMSLRPRSTTTAPSSPGPAHQSPPPNTSATTPSRALGDDAGEATHVLGESIEIESGQRTRRAPSSRGAATTAAKRKRHDSEDGPAMTGRDIHHSHRRQSPPTARPGFITLPERTSKPRRTGVSHVLDNGISLAETEQRLAAASDFIDVWKFGWGTAYIDPSLDAKLDLLIPSLRQSRCGGC